MKPHEKDTQDCLAIEDNKTALVCLKQVVAQYSKSDVCRPKLVLLTNKGCLPCKGEAALHADDIAKGIVQQIDFTSPEGMEIAKKNDIEFIPALVLLDCRNNLIMPA